MASTPPDPLELGLGVGTPYSPPTAEVLAVAPDPTNGIAGSPGTPARPEVLATPDSFVSIVENVIPTSINEIGPTAPEVYVINKETLAIKAKRILDHFTNRIPSVPERDRIANITSDADPTS